MWKPKCFGNWKVIFSFGVTKQGLIYFFHFFSCLVGGASPLKRKVLFWFFVFVVTLYFLFTLGFRPGRVKFCQPRLFSPGRVWFFNGNFSTEFFKGKFSKRFFVFDGNVSTELFPKGFFVFHGNVSTECFPKRFFVCLSIGKFKRIFLKRNFCLSIGKFKANLSQIEFLFGRSFSVFAILPEIYKFQLDCPGKQFRRNLILQLSDSIQVLLFCG